MKYPPLDNEEIEYLNLLNFNGLTWEKIGKKAGMDHRIIYKAFTGMTNPYPKNREKIESFVRRAKETKLLEILKAGKPVYRDGKPIKGITENMDCTRTQMKYFSTRLRKYLKKIRFPHSTFRKIYTCGGVIRIMSRFHNVIDYTFIYRLEDWKEAKSLLLKRSQELLTRGTDVEDYMDMDNAK